MELKRFQKDVIADLTRFLALLSEKQNIPKAYEAFWNEKNVPIGLSGLSPYRTEIPGVPDVCFKVPTGGGKTFIACNSIKPIFDALPYTKAKAVVWLVPSDSILEQTYKALTSADHPYRQRINSDFGNRVEVYGKQQLLNGQDFSPTTVRERLSIFVLSYDSFRISKKDGRKAYQENGNLAPFARYAKPEHKLEDADDTALIQAIRSLEPIVIVDESHHATSDLSLEMLKNFNPSFILDLTATPKSNSNVISYVDAAQLKRENMVKLPVIVYNRKTHSDVFLDAITIRNNLEAKAKIDQARTGRYIRPIVLLQAQPRGKDENTTFTKLRHALVEMGIPEDWIAIKTAEINELKNVDLLSETCPIRYIITVNALKEGWDCPFAYVLATIANRTSAVDVEQILGRILRLPYTAKNETDMLNISYVLTSSNDFRDTLTHVIAALNRAGFSSRDYHAEDLTETIIEAPVSEQLQLKEPVQEDDLPEIDTARIRAYLENQPVAEKQAESLFAPALEQAGQYEEAFAHMDEDFQFGPMEVSSKMNVFRMEPQFEEEARTLRIPQFFVDAPASLFSETAYALLDESRLAKGFSLRGKDTKIDFVTLDAEIAKVDIAETANAKPRVFDLSNRDSVYIKEWFNSLPPESRLQHGMSIIYKQLSKNDAINDKELKDYIKLVVDGFSADQLSDLEQSPYPYVKRFEDKVKSLLLKHNEDTFNLWIEQGKIICRPSYALKAAITPVRHTGILPKSLYSEEDDMNDFEYEVARRLAALDNVKWWHRNISRNGFYINGFINMYPDFIVLTKRGTIILVEPKGDHLENSESRQKVALGRSWEHKAGTNYRYYMVFKNKDLAVDGAFQVDRFIEIIKAL
ncbi:MAG TPA: DEAD/DEAH box helicase family protein [Clostridia bacterium]|nr:DEAD/DEAH box helicase family protein [Clostridia bacterium]